MKKKKSGAELKLFIDGKLISPDTPAHLPAGKSQQKYSRKSATLNRENLLAPGERFLFSSAVITDPGTYRYRHIDLQAARQWIEAGPYYSTIRYRETAAALAALLGRRIETRDEQVKMKPGDEALVFRLVFPPGTRGLPTDQKGKVSVQLILDNCELGVLERTA